jgi:hypothetical protein
MAVDDEDIDDSTPGLSPEERISKLEKGKTLHLIVIILLAVFSITQMAGIGYLMISSPVSDIEANKSEFAALNAQVFELEKAQNKTDQLIIRNKALEEKIDRVLAEANIDNFANLRSMLASQEENHAEFIIALEQGMYELSRMVRGSRTWYEVYKEELDKVVEDSKARSAKLAMMAPDK